METLAFFGQFLGGIGLLTLGAAAFWFVSVYKDNRE